jgi:uracil-DNA glycosylase family 4
VVKHRPPGNRDPEPMEIAACADYLDRQIAAVQPKVIVTLGRFSMARYFPNAKITAIHGQARTVNGQLIVAMYHPAAGLRLETTRQALIEDFKKLPQLIAKAHAQRDPAPPSAPEDKGPAQLSLF